MFKYSGASLSATRLPSRSRVVKKSSSESGETSVTSLKLKYASVRLTRDAMPERSRSSLRDSQSTFICWNVDPKARIVGTMDAFILASASPGISRPTELKSSSTASARISMNVCACRLCNSHPASDERCAGVKHDAGAISSDVKCVPRLAMSRSASSSSSSFALGNNAGLASTPCMTSSTGWYSPSSS